VKAHTTNSTSQADSLTQAVAEPLKAEQTSIGSTTQEQQKGLRPDSAAAIPLIDVQNLTTAFGSHVVHEHLNLKLISLSAKPIL
jgi:hypothetical protein